MMDWHEALKGLMGQGGAPSGGGPANFNAANLASPMQFDPAAARSQVMGDKLGQLGALLMAGGMRQTDAQRANVFANMGEALGHTGRDMSQAYQAQQHAMETEKLARDQSRLSQLDSQARTKPEFLKGLGLTPEQYSALGPEGLMKVIQTNAARDPTDISYKQALIDQAKQPHIGVIGEDEFGNKTYGDTRTGLPVAQPPGPAGRPVASSGQPVGLVESLNGLSGAEAIKKLKELDPSVGAEVEQIAAGNQPFPQRMLGTKRGQVLSTLVSMVDPEYNAATYDLRKRVRADYNNSTLNSAGGQIKYANTGIKHGAELFELADKVPNWHLGPASHVANMADAALQGANAKAGGVNSYKQAAMNFMDEVAKALGAGASGEREKLLAQLDAANGPDAIKEVLRTQIGLLRDKIGTMENSWKENMGNAAGDRKFFDPDAQKALDKMFPPEKKAEGAVTTQIAPEHFAQSIANARDAIAKNPANRAAILKKLSDHGIPTEGL